jgi:hypothetical protein
MSQHEYKKIEKENFQNTYLYSGVNNIPNIKKERIFLFIVSHFFFIKFIINITNKKCDNNNKY